MKAFLLSQYISGEEKNYAVILEQTLETAARSLKAEVVRIYSFPPLTADIHLSEEAVLSSGIPALITDRSEENFRELTLQEIPLVTSYPLP